MSSEAPVRVPTLGAVGVVVPVHDEIANLASCLAALDAALGDLPPELRRHAVVVLDACSDGSELAARAWRAACPAERSVVEGDFRNVGRARAAGMAAVLEILAERDPERVWLATTDADSLVPRAWLTEQVRMAAEGADAIAGSIRVDDWSQHPPGFAERFRQFYEPTGSSDAHDHVHGANLGVRADAYLAAGGFEPLATGEDHALWGALRRAQRLQISSRRIAVVTSARRRGRAPLGFASFLGDFAPDAAAVGDDR